MTTRITSTGWTLRIGSAGGILGALLGLIGNLLHPATPTGDPEGVARTIADSRIWVPAHLAIVAGLVLMLGGLVAISQSIQGGLPGALARLGLVAARRPSTSPWPPCSTSSLRAWPSCSTGWRWP